jgi:hypothetical protein
MSEIPDLRPGYYYVSCVRDDGAWRPVRGPWTSHADALAAVPLVKAEAEGIDPRAFWYAWGTLRASDDLGPGILGPALDMTPSASGGPGARQARCGAECRACRRPDIEPDDLEWDARAGTGGAELLRVLGFDLQRSPEVTHLCSPEMTHTIDRDRVRSFATAHSSAGRNAAARVTAWRAGPGGS